VTSTFAARWQELARRPGNGVEIVLLGDSSANRLKVAVIDERLCHHVDFDLVGADAVDVFAELFADAATQRSRTTDDFRGAGRSLVGTGSDEGANS
jgi:hypothetical protein